MSIPEKAFNGFVDGFQFIWTQTKKPIRHPTFLLFFLIAICVFGSIGVWYELRNIKNADYQPLFNAIILLTPPFVSGAYFQIILNKDTPQFAKCLLGFFVFLAGYIFFELIGTKFEAKLWYIYIFTAAMTFITLWITWIQLSLSDDLYDKPVKKAALGGENLAQDLDGKIPEGFES
ncbi:hypothetical protein [Acinetobacter sp. XH1639]|uniref:hypothetical protein n=1 Tax=Acinetobacter sp. XH1639 TaxID=3157368 RepID=UPI0032B407C6